MDNNKKANIYQNLLKSIRNYLLVKYINGLDKR